MNRRAPKGLSFLTPDGGVEQFTVSPISECADATIELMDVLVRRDFDVCPVCFSTEALTAEHVLPARLGGSTATLTCADCNNLLGSRIDSDLVDFLEDAVQLKLEGVEVVGRRTLGRALVRVNSSGNAALFVHGEPDSGALALMQSRHARLLAIGPHPDRVRLAALKQMYLAYCVAFGIPRGVVADAVRRDLLAARNTPRRERPPLSEYALGMTVLRCDEAVGEAPQGLVLAVLRAGGAEIPGVLLQGRLFLSFSSNQSPVFHQIDGRDSVTMPIDIGDPVESEIVERTEFG